MKDSFLTITKPAEGIYKEKGSKFISHAYPVHHEHEINETIRIIKRDYHDARHHCYAWKLSGEDSRYRVNDDGEPSGTGGKPILGQINSHKLSDILIIVTRYFGGVLLGTGGLANAYKTAAANALQNACITEKYLYDTYSLRFNYTDLNRITRIIEELKGKMYDHEYEMDCSMKVKIRKSLSNRYCLAIESFRGDNYSVVNTKIS